MLTDLPTPHPILPTETKNQWARDDPAFVVVTAAMVFVVSILYCLFYSHSFGQAVYAVLRSVLVDFLGVGAGVATAYWFVANRYMREPGVNHSHAVEQQVEWMYAFDVHVNAFFTLLPSLYCGQLVLSPLLMMNGSSRGCCRGRCTASRCPTTTTACSSGTTRYPSWSTRRCWSIPSRSSRS